MSRRSSSLHSNTVGINRDIGSAYDNVKLVAENIDDVITLSDNLDDISTTVLNISSIAAIGPNIPEIEIVAADIADVVIVSASIADVSLVATNIVDVQNALSNASAAAASAAAASTSETNAANSETAAGASETAAGLSETNASASASAASTSETNALNSANSASASESNASTSAGNAATSESNASASALSATSSANSAAASLASVELVFDSFDDRYLGAKSADPTLDNDGDALLAGACYWNTTLETLRFYNGAVWEDPQASAYSSAVAAALSETNAAASESAASLSESNASTSAGAAGTSQSNAAASETNAATSESNASTSETNAAASESAASTSEANALTSETNAAASLAAMNGTYLGAQASDPTLDLNGDPVDSGDWYFNTGSSFVRIYDGTSWFNGTSDTASFLLKAGDTMTGELNVPSVQFAGGAGSQGTVSWNTDEETLDLVQNGATLQLGQEIQIHCRNNTGSAILNGTTVMATGTLGASGRVTVAPMVSDGSIPSHFYLGVATEDIAAGEDGKVTTFGKVRGLDTSGYSEGQVLYCDPAVPGGFSTTLPEAPNLKLATAYVINVHASAGAIMVRANSGTDLNNDHRVEILSPDANGNPQVANSLLVWDNTQKRWENKTPVEVGTTLAYDNTTSGLTASTFQSAVDEISVLVGGGNVGSQASFDSYEFTATEGQTTFELDTVHSATYVPGYIQVFFNGVLLSAVDYTAANGADIVLATGASAGDLLMVATLDSFNIANLLRVTSIDASASDNVLSVDSSDNVVVSGGLSVAEIVAAGTLGVTGATTMTGDLTIDRTTDVQLNLDASDAASGAVATVNAKTSNGDWSFGTDLGGTNGQWGLYDRSSATMMMTVQKTSGNVSLAGTLGVAGAVTLSNDLTINKTGNALLSITGGDAAFIRLRDSGGSTNQKYVDLVTDNGSFDIRLLNDDTSIKSIPIAIAPSGGITVVGALGVAGALTPTGGITGNLVLNDGSLKITAATTIPSVDSDGEAVYGSAGTANGAVIRGQGSTNDYLLQNKNEASVMSVQSGTTTVQMLGAATIASNLDVAGRITNTVTSGDNIFTLAASGTNQSTSLLLGAESGGAFSMSIAAQGASAGGKGLSIRKDSFVGSEAAFFGYDLSTSLRGNLGVAGATTAAGGLYVSGPYTGNVLGRFQTAGMEVDISISGGVGRIGTSTTGAQDFALQTDGIDRLTLDGTTGNATFAGAVTVSDGYFYGLETANNQSMLLNATHASFASSMIDLRATRSGGSAYNFLMCYSSVTADPELYIRGDGTTISDGPYAGTGADYAEYFEYADGNSDAENRAGVSMVLENGLMRQAVHGEIPFAVISRNPSIVGGGDISRHKDKYLRTAYGNYDLDSEGERQLNPYWDSELEYVSREDRDEWDTAGLVGKLRVNNDSVIAPNWIKMRDINEYVSEYFTFPTDQHLYAWRDKVTEWQDERDIKIAELEARLAALEAA
jgi:hypothetical protein